MYEEFINKLFKRNSKNYAAFPDKKQAEQFMDDLFEFLFLPNDIQQKTVPHIANRLSSLKIQFFNLLYNVAGDEKQTNKYVEKFFGSIPQIYDFLIEDAESILQFDPASESLEEILVAYPGFYATAVYRLAHELYGYNIPILPRLLSEYAHNKTGIDIHPGATIGHPFFIDHGTGIVIGETTIIGNNVKIYQGVTLGALSVAKELSESKRHPTIEDNVIIYAGSTILGGDTVVGRDSIIGGNVWLTSSVPSNSVVYHKSEITVKDMLPGDELILNWVI
ncbi:MAG TPA: serine O-acetyltransferase [Niabella sp.]|jgi:serine O-acetyltransferase|nr:serine O-acetyltransferase [Chitinophagaceae bacterium]HRN46813.1 serine O-acetyltransferase [Niabella sp.]HRO83754.1 serine O-acetyltransferase [Niabella sp.]HUN01525.1 serine O-acetyltransferase [Niabella sp.]